MSAKQGIYIHIPFCTSKCRYCDFLSFPSHRSDLQLAYAEALSGEIRTRIRGEWRHADTVFIGGGTPTALSDEALNRILSAVNDSLDMHGLVEFTAEANPGSVTPAKLQLLREGGVNRLSFGVQNFRNKLLRLLGRTHTADEARAAVFMAREAEFDNINLDLMYGLPGEIQEDWRNDVDAAMALEPEHLSLYQLMIEPHTALERMVGQGNIPRPDEDAAAAAFEWQQIYLAEHGYCQYEISNYSLPGRESEHNQIYWRLDNYLGLGLGSTGWERPCRQTNTTDLFKYLRTDWEHGDAVAEKEVLSLRNQMSESVFMALRMNSGLNCSAFIGLYGVSAEEVFEEAINKNLSQGLLKRENGHLRLTNIGRSLGNLVFETFL